MARLVQREALKLTGEGAATLSPVNATRPIRRTSVAAPTAPTVERATPIRRTATTPKPVATPPIGVPEPPAPQPTTPRKPRGPAQVAQVKPTGFQGGNQRFAQRFPNTTSLRAMGAINPLAPFKTEGVSGLRTFLPPKGLSKGARAGRAFAAANMISMLMNGQVGAEADDIKTWYKELGYPDDVADVASKAYLDAAKIGTGASGMADYLVKDLQFAGSLALGGAAIGSVVPGVGTLAGAGIGWATGTTIAGVNSILVMGEQLVNAAMGNDGMNGQWFNIPTIDDFMPGISGVVGQENYYATAEMSAGAAGADMAIAQQFPNRFNNTEYVARELQRLDSNYYGRSAEQDPRAQEMYDLISKGYFVKEMSGGRLGIDNQAYYDYLSKTMMYRDMEDKKSFLPMITPAGQILSSQGTLTEDQWYKLFSNAE